MTVRRRAVLGLVILAALAVGAFARTYWMRRYAPAFGTVAQLGKKLPALPVVDEEGRTADLRELVKGTRSIAVFYSATCQVCQLTLPQMLPFPSNLRLIMVNEDAEAPLIHAGMFGFDNPLMFYDREHVLSRSFPMCGVPTILFIDEQGILRDGLIGQHAQKAVQNKLQEFAGRRLS
jgi:hypothetical protein